MTAQPGSRTKRFYLAVPKKKEPVTEEEQLKHIMDVLDPEPLPWDVMSEAVARALNAKLADLVFQESPLLKKLRS